MSALSSSAPHPVFKATALPAEGRHSRVRIASRWEQGPQGETYAVLGTVTAVVGEAEDFAALINEADANIARISAVAALWPDGLKEPQLASLCCCPPPIADDVDNRVEWCPVDGSGDRRHLLGAILELLGVVPPVNYPADDGSVPF